MLHKNKTRKQYVRDISICREQQFVQPPWSQASRH